VRIAFALAAAAAALAAAAPLDAARARATFFGVDMSGVTGGAAPVAWRECVTPKGDTVYWFQGQVDRGRLRVRDDGALCFSYQSSGFHEEGCFAAFAARDGQYRFASLSGDSTFVTRSIRTGVKACSAQPMVS